MNFDAINNNCTGTWNVRSTNQGQLDMIKQEMARLNIDIIGISELSEVKSLSRVQCYATPWTVAHQAPPSMGFSRREYWSGLPFPSPEDLPNPGIEPRSPALRADALTSEPPWIRVGELDSVNHYIYHCGQESLRRHGVALRVNKSLKCSTWVQSQTDRMISVGFQGNPFNIIVIQVYAKEAEHFYDDLQDRLEHQKKMSFSS